ncbi:T-cell surface glycoprotein CD3 zeta chain [Lampris incognitus]|uniref:T-cell surface glycoprotein CD3 zeta chain n=1 Tax=Lampris incognitus TaxID=2546036 RepID=UPI0024B530AC|nr:T-cell surface glycoprotein CD3 zeta chain [Lampris incognitus]
MDLKKTAGLLALISLFPPADAVHVYDPKLCYMLDGLLALYCFIITALFIKEKYFTTKAMPDESLYTDLKGQSSGGYAPLAKRDPERGRNRRGTDDIYTDLKKTTDGEYKELPVKRERHRKNEQVYQGLSSVTKDTYDSLQMQPLPPR